MDIFLNHTINAREFYVKGGRNVNKYNKNNKTMKKKKTTTTTVLRNTEDNSDYNPSNIFLSRDWSKHVT